MDGVGDAVAEARKQFRGELPPAVEALDEAAVRDLATALRDSRRRQNALLAEKTEESLRHLPRLIRPVVRKVIGL